MRTVPLTHQRVNIQDDFDLDKILESGQCFRPRKLADGRCRFVSGKALLYLTPLGCRQYDAAWYGADWDVWAGYFDLGRSYAALRQSLAGQSAYLDAALAFGQGIRVLRQDPWEMLITFIISQRKSIPAIRTAVEQLARCCGEPLCAEGDEVFLFPTPEQLCGLTEAQLTGCGLGYRTRYIQHAAAQAAARTLDLDALAVLPDNALFSRLLTLDGVGKKVANCVCLFGYGRTAMAPTVQAMPLPPRKPKYSGHICPTIAKTAATQPPSRPARYRPSRTASAAFAASPAKVKSAAFRR